MEISVSFPGGKKVDARFEGFTVQTDQPTSNGGEGSAPDPFSYFLASLATCAGIYVVGFCQARNLPYGDIRVVQKHETNAEGKLVGIHLEVQLPADFPVHYREAVARAANGCKVKKLIADPPVIDVKASISGETLPAPAPNAG